MRQEMYIALFIKFLKENNVYSEYKKLWLNGRRDCKDFKVWIFRTNPCNYLFSAFNWPSSDWSLLHSRWLKLIVKSEKLYIKHERELRTTRSI